MSDDCEMPRIAEILDGEMLPLVGSGGFEGRAQFDPGVQEANMFITGMINEWVRQQTEREESIARAALEMNCGYAVIEERKLVTSTPSASAVTVYHYVIGPWIPSGLRLVFPGWDAWEAWNRRGRGWTVSIVAEDTDRAGES